ncbi:MAG: L,D-transpeptidase family protein [Candidatus Omnitrophica bacterium]|nr:L,D-transpeptidase family protein [Candidatus Omnitrophota bacterium]
MKKQIVFMAAAVILALIAGVFLMRGLGSANKSRQAADSLNQLISSAKGMEEKGALLEAKTVYARLINDYPASKEVSAWQKKVEAINTQLLFSNQPGPYSVMYEVKPGDSLTKIAAGYNTTVELLKKMNGITGDMIVPGKKLKVINVPFNILVDKSQNVLMLKIKDEIIKTYVVSTGKDNSTPVGTFKIVNKLMNPTWFKAGAVVPPESAENILGSRWLGFNLAGYGIHGTTEPQNLGKQVTQGCVRMANQEVEELYTIVPVSTEVTIID